MPGIIRCIFKLYSLISNLFVLSKPKIICNLFCCKCIYVENDNLNKLCIHERNIILRDEFIVRPEW